MADMTPPAKYLALGLERGKLYRKAGSTETRRYVFQRWEIRRCQLHGDKLGWEAVFQVIKPSGKISAAGAQFDPLETPVEPATA